MTLTKYERETIINYNEECGKADVFTASKPVMNKLDKLCEQFPDTYQCIKREHDTAEYLCPKNRIKFVKPPSEKQKEAGRERMAKLHSKAL